MELSKKLKKRAKQFKQVYDDFAVVRHEEIKKWIKEVEKLEMKISCVSQCSCTKDKKHGETSVMCCNDCGLPTEKFWIDSRI